MSPSGDSNKNPPDKLAAGGKNKNARSGYPTLKASGGLNHSMRALTGRMRERFSRVEELGSVSIKSDFIR